MDNFVPNFCFDLSYNQEITAFLPSIYLMQNESNLAYIDKKITKERLSIFSIDWNLLDNDYKQLFTIENDLKLENLEKKFKISKKNTFADVIANKSVSALFFNYIESKIDLFLNLCKKNNYSISINLQNHREFYRYKKTFGANNLIPKLKFDKHEAGMSYFLFLIENEISLIPSENNTLILTNEPSWIVLNDSFFFVEQINGNKIKPFLDKSKIEIPSHLTATYFEKFIKDIVKKVSIEANGFKVEKKDNLIGCKLQLVHDFFKDIYKVEPQFVYENVIFKNHSLQKSKISLNIEDLSNISVIDHCRNFEKEAKFLSYLQQLGLILENGMFSLANQNSLEIVDFLTEKKAELIQFGFDLSDIQVNQKQIILEKASLDFSKELIDDWFDIKIKIKIGEYEISFVDIVENIKNNDSYFLLPNGKYFIIPKEWMSHFGTLYSHGKTTNHKLILPKNKEGLLVNFQDYSKEKDSKPVEYSQSNLVKAVLRPYQIEGIKWLLQHYFNQTGACLADDMGLGKTLQTLATLVAIQEEIVSFENENNDFPMDLFSIKTMKKEALKALVVLPNTLLFNWHNEAQKFTPHFSKIVYTGNNRHEITKKLLNYDLIFTTYSIITKDIELLKKMRFRVIVLDESQQIKNKDSKIFKSINSIESSFRISLSGTPIENSLSDLWSQMQFINPDILGTFSSFTKSFIVPIQKQKSEQALQTLQQIIQPFLLRRTRKSVLQELPELTEQTIYCEMSKEQKKWYESEKSKARNFILDFNKEKVNKINVLNSLMKLRQLSNHPKMIDENSEMESGKFIEVTHNLEIIKKSNLKVLIFSAFVSHLNLYTAWCKENNYHFSMITGDVKDRENEVHKFETDAENQFFFISLKAGSTGLNLTSANYVFLLDPWWNPSVEEQAIARSYRMGQQNKVNVIRFVSKESIEEKILMLQKTKKQLSESVISEFMIEDEITSNITEILA